MMPPLFNMAAGAFQRAAPRRAFHLDARRYDLVDYSGGHLMTRHAEAMMAALLCHYFRFSGFHATFTIE